MDFLATEKIFVMDENFFVLDKKYFVLAEGRGIRYKITTPKVKEKKFTWKMF